MLARWSPPFVCLFLRLTRLQKRRYDARMDRLFLIDHSLRDTGGHHFDYVRSLASAAQQAGIGVTIGCHQDLAVDSRKKDIELSDALHQLGDVRAVFTETVYQRDSWLAGLRCSKRSGPIRDVESNVGAQGRLIGGWMDSIKQRRAKRRRQHVIRQFSDGCRDFFASRKPQPGDQVLVAAASELEVAGAVDFLMEWPQSLRANWHFLFHFNLLDGWTSEYASQRVAMMRTRGVLHEAIRKLPDDSLHFHATTQTIADQFNCLRTARVTALPYPISSDLLPERIWERSVAVSKTIQNDVSAPVTFVCAGATRREKGQASCLQGLVDRIKEPLLLTGKAKLLVQRPRQKRFGKSWLDLSLGDEPTKKDQDLQQHLKQHLEKQSASSLLDINPIEYAAHPLPRDEYRQLLRSADVGLFCYDSRSYFSRCAGVLVEMLACGKPVIVPAGTWLADQIQEPIQLHVKRFQQQNTARAKLEHADFKFDRQNVPSPGGVWSFDEDAHPFTAAVDCERGDQTAVVRFDWHWPKLHGLYARVVCVQFDDDQHPLATTAQAIGVTRHESSPRFLFPLQQECRSVEFRLTNAFANGTLTIRNFSMELYSHGPALAEVPVGPIGAVGIIAASQKELPQCVAEAVANIDHYRQTAQQFSQEWIHRHHPQRTVNRLFGLRVSSARAA